MLYVKSAFYHRNTSYFYLKLLINKGLYFYYWAFDRKRYTNYFWLGGAAYLDCVV